MKRATLSLSLWLAAMWSMACEPERGLPKVSFAPAEISEVEGWDVKVSTDALEVLPMSCFRREAMFVTAHDLPPSQQRWAWVPGAPDELFVGDLRFTLGDAGTVRVPTLLHAHDGTFHATHVRSQLSSVRKGSTEERSETTLSLNTDGKKLRGTLHLLALRGCTDEACTQPELRCEVSLAVTGRKMGPDLVAAAF